MMTPMARSTTFPRIANFLNSSSMHWLPASGAAGPSARTSGFALLGPSAMVRRTPRPLARAVAGLVDQTGVDHGIAHGGFGLVRQRYHWQANGCGTLSQDGK